MGVVTYRRLKMIVLIMSQKIKQMEGEYIGILLPSSIIAYALVLATLLAKKVPVMLNFTLGSRALDHCRKVVDLKTVLSSRRFLIICLAAILIISTDLIRLVEDIRETVSFWAELRAIYGLFRNTDMILKEWGLNQISEDDTAVLLFTSGTESLPKGVPLSHKNILSNLKSAMECFEFLPHR